MESFKISAIIKASPKKIYDAWLNSRKHGEMVGAAAKINPMISGAFEIWDGYITGTTVELAPWKKIVQKWRTSEFPPDSPDSILEVQFKEVKGGTRMTLIHKNIPDKQGDSYKQGWKDNYFEPMKEYF